jgi:hypothetical protein
MLPVFAFIHISIPISTEKKTRRITFQPTLAHFVSQQLQTWKRCELLKPWKSFFATPGIARVATNFKGHIQKRFGYNGQ